MVYSGNKLTNLFEFQNEYFFQTYRDYIKAQICHSRPPAIKLFKDRIIFVQARVGIPESEV